MDDLLSSDEWCEMLDVEVFDPDGWDRKNFEASWAERITHQEFRRRVGASTCRWTRERLAAWNANKP